MASENNNIESDKDGTDEAWVKLAATDCCYGASEEIRYRRIGNERRIPFAFWPSSQECLHRTLLIVLSKAASGWKLVALFYSCQVWQHDESSSYSTWKQLSLPPWENWCTQASSCPIPFHWASENKEEDPLLCQYPKKRANFLGKGYNVQADLAC